MEHFIKYQELNEALKLSQYRDYHGTRGKRLENKLNGLFGGKNRIYIPFEYKVEDSKPNNDVELALKKEGYKITNYLEGYCEKDGRTFRIGKILNKLDRQDLLLKFNEDPNRAVQNKKLLICISKHPYDIAGMSTDRGWTSCMKLDGENSGVIKEEIKEGTVIAYLINEDDKNINHPYGRINIKPYLNQKDDIAWGLASKCYGSLLNYGYELSDFFKEYVEKWVDENLNKNKKGIYTLDRYVYDEAPYEILLGDKNSQEYKLFKWGMYIHRLKDDVYNGDIFAPKDIKEFKGFKEELGLDIKEVNGSLSFYECTSLTSISDFPKTIGRYLTFYGCTSLTSISDFPKTIGRDLSFEGCDNLVSVSNLPEKIGGTLNFGECTSLISIPKMPSVVRGTIYTDYCPFFEGMTGDQTRLKYNIEPIDPKFREWGISKDLMFRGGAYDGGIYDGGIYVPYDIKEFRGFKEELGLDIKEVKGNLSFSGCTSLTSVSNLPTAIMGFLSFGECTSLTSIEKMPIFVAGNLDFNNCTTLTSISNIPTTVGKAIYSIDCPFFKGMNEKQIRQKYNISR